MSVRAVCRPSAMIRSAPSRLAARTPQRADGAVADDGDGGAGPHAGAEGGVVAGAQDVGEGEQRGQEPVVGGRLGGQLDEGAVGEGNADGLALAAVGAHGAPEAAARAGGLEALGAVRAGAVGPDEGGDDEVALPEAADPGPASSTTPRNSWPMRWPGCRADSPR